MRTLLALLAAAAAAEDVVDCAVDPWVRPGRRDANVSARTFEPYRA
eukprot:CAMPEP_0119293862 /NCGR_PEP_ID=MMETSP1329-20130426/46830_1 /TAXON_ID=114041 /ORGANISM="Genus nov. species nov., Strain RCC1024" /LENGTH=45 /DNA_ID= /DNA_START= /DNA_END= /DNA_ORIENTATION=